MNHPSYLIISLIACPRDSAAWRARDTGLLPCGEIIEQFRSGLTAGLSARSADSTLAWCEVWYSEAAGPVQETLPGTEPSAPMTCWADTFEQAARICAARLEEWSDAHPVNSEAVVLHFADEVTTAPRKMEQWAGLVRAKLGQLGMRGGFWNLCRTERSELLIPSSAELDECAEPMVRTLFRMSSPVEEAGSEWLAQANLPRPASARLLVAGEVWPGFSLGDGVAAHLTRAVRQAPSQLDYGLEFRSFLLAKEGYDLSECEDAVGADLGRRVFCVSDGAGTASYSAEWARTLCRRALECPPPGRLVCPDGELDRPQIGELQAWLAGALGYWEPEVPWERLRRPAFYNKARQGAGATLAGVQLNAAPVGAAVGYRGWALGDSCVLHLRQGVPVLAKPLSDPGKFGIGPCLLLTRAGQLERRARSWESWEGELQPGDVLVVATDAASKFLLQTLGQRQRGSWDWLLGLLGSSPGQARASFEQSIRPERRSGALEDDDVALVLVRLRKV